MGRLVDGKWVKTSIITSDESGSYARIPRSFLNTIATGHAEYRPESDRYHLYVSYACPWAHRTLIYRQLKGLSNHIDVSVVHPDMLDYGWTFDTNFPGATADNLYQHKLFYQLYQAAQPGISTSVTVPVLWDKRQKTIVNNESSEIIRIFNSSFNEITGNTADFYPPALRPEIDSWNEQIYEYVNNGVYRCGFAKKQAAYDEAVTRLFATLDKVEAALEKQDYLVGNQLTEADLRLIPTLLRFDIVYHGHFKCNIRRISDYPNLSRYTKRLFKIPAISETTHFDHIKRHYYYSHESINPSRIVPMGPSMIIPGSA